MELRPVEGNKDLVRDLSTGAILNVNKEAFAGAKRARQLREKAKQQLETNTNDINSIKDQLTEIKTMLRTLIDGR
tara:strand:+ start:246 stop:470 length:225 start_codon:yes stop_codon:yes gene_type:complete